MYTHIYIYNYDVLTSIGLRQLCALVLDRSLIHVLTYKKINFIKEKLKIRWWASLVNLGPSQFLRWAQLCPSLVINGLLKPKAQQLPSNL